MDANSNQNLELTLPEEFKKLCLESITNEIYFYRNVLHKNFNISIDVFIKFLTQLSEEDLYLIFSETRMFESWYVALIKEKEADHLEDISLEESNVVGDYLRDNLADTAFVKKIELHLASYIWDGVDSEN